MYDTEMALQHGSYAQLLAANARAARARLGLTQASVARRMKALGFPWYPQTSGAVERGERPLSADEILGLSLALEVTVDLLMLPPRAEEVTLPGGQVIELPGTADLPRVWSRGWWDGDTPKFPTAQQSVVAAVVTSAKGVLAGRRNDATPPWTFIAGEAEPGERPEDTAVREVKEETGLEVRAGRIIGERDHHPATGRHMIYIAAKPVRGTKVIVGDEAELAEVRWLSLAEADELLPGMYGPVREHLARELKPTNR